MQELPEDLPEDPTSLVLEHFDIYLGEIKSGWRTKDKNDQPSSVSLAKFTLEPASNWMLLGTYGLSQYELVQGEDESELRQELLLCWPEAEEVPVSLLSHLNAVAQTVEQTREVLMRGELLSIPEGQPLPSGGPAPWKAWYVTLPFFLPEQGIMLDAIDPPMVLTWLFPVYEDEAEFITLEGADAFDEVIIANRQTCFLQPRPSLLENL